MRSALLRLAVPAFALMLFVSAIAQGACAFMCDLGGCNKPVAVQGTMHCSGHCCCALRAPAKGELTSLEHGGCCFDSIYNPLVSYEKRTAFKAPQLLAVLPSQLVWLAPPQVPAYSAAFYDDLAPPGPPGSKARSRAPPIARV